MSIPQPCIMAIDDDNLMLRFLEMALCRAGYGTIAVQDPDRVPEALTATHPDLVLLDLRLSGTSGFDLFETIRHQSDVPVIFLSASNRTADRQHALALGAKDYIEKPFSRDCLLEAVALVLKP